MNLTQTKIYENDACRVGLGVSHVSVSNYPYVVMLYIHNKAPNLPDGTERDWTLAMTLDEARALGINLVALLNQLDGGGE